MLIKLTRRSCDASPDNSRRSPTASPARCWARRWGMPWACPARGCRLGPSPGGSGGWTASACWAAPGSSPTTPSRRRWWPRRSPATPTTWTLRAGLPPVAAGLVLPAPLGRRDGDDPLLRPDRPGALPQRSRVGRQRGGDAGGGHRGVLPRPAREREAFGRALAEVTHRDVRAVEGALYVAEMAAACAEARAAHRPRSAAGGPPHRRQPSQATRMAVEFAGARDPARRRRPSSAEPTGFAPPTLAFATFCFLATATTRSAP